MNARANAIKTLYDAKRITINGVRKAVVEGILTKEDFLKITGEEYVG